jgi:hypothetical protein
VTGAAGRGALPQEHRQLARLLLVEALEVQGSHVHVHRRERRAQRSARGRNGRGALRGEEQEGRRVRVSHDLVEQRHAVGVGPLQIVDHHHQAATRGQTRQELPHRHEELAPELLRILHPLAGGGGLRDGLDAPEHGEDLAEQRRLERDQRGLIGPRQARHEAAERVHHAVEGLEGDELALVATARQDDHVVALGEQLVGEVLDQDGLADPRLPFDQHGDRVACGAGVERLAQREELRLPSHEGRGHAARIADPARRIARRRRQPANDVFGRRARRWIDAQELHGQRFQIRRHAEDARAGRIGGAQELLDQDVDGAPREGHLADERLVEQRPQRVQICLGSDRPRRRLLGRHVRGGADHVQIAGVPIDGLGVHGQAEVEEDDAPFGGDADVGGLDVAVDEPPRVQRREPGGQIDERGAQARDVGAAPGRTDGVDAPLLGDGRRLVANADVVEEVDPLDELHGEKPLALLGDQVAEAHQAGVVQIL